MMRAFPARRALAELAQKQAMKKANSNNRFFVVQSREVGNNSE
jgi:hypothetical protein